MTAFGLTRLILTLWALFLSAACTVGGGGGSPTAGGGIGGTGITSGEITDFGSIEVNGTFYDIGNAAITVDGQPANESALKLGMVVDVTFDLYGGKRTATRVVQEDVAEGAAVASDLSVASTSPLIANLTLLEQNVLIGEQTNFFDESGSPSDFTAFQAAISLATPASPIAIEVSGHVIESGLTEATYIKVNTPPATTVLRGIVKNHMPTAMPPTFQIGDLIIDYGSQPADISKMPDPATTSWNDLLVQVLGQSIGPAGELIAKKVEPKTVEADDGALVEIEGFVTAVTQRDAENNAVEFVIQDITVRITGSTVIENCEREDIDVGSKLEVDGTFDSGDDVLIANLITCKDNVKLESDIAAPFDPMTNMFTLEGLPGVIVIVTSGTKFQSQDPLKPNDLNDLAAKDHVRVQGRETSGGNVVIVRRVQKRTSQPTRAILQGPVDSISGSNITILNVTVDTSDPFVFKDVDGSSISRTVFFGSLSPGTVVKLQGTLSPSAPVTVDWEEAQLEDD